MRIKLFLIMAAILPLFGCAGEDCAEFDGEKGGVFAVSFGTAAPTRAFFDGNPAGEPWEREIRTLEAIVCDGAGNTLHRRQLNRTEIDAGKALFPEAVLPPGDDYTVCLLANYDTSGISGGFDNLADGPVTKYNGEYSQMQQKCIASGGFAMAAAGTLTPAHTLSNPLHLPLRRTVSKLELKITVGDGISPSRPNGELEIIETFIDHAAPTVPLFGSTAGMDETSLTQTPFEQESRKEYCNVFYLFAHETLIPSITLKARFYPDGKAVNSANFTEHAFTLAPNMSVGPNTYYRLSATISELKDIVIEPEFYTLKYMADGGYVGQEYQVPSGETHYVMSGENWSSLPGDYMLRCWNTKPDGTGRDYYPYETITVNEDIVFYPLWEPVPQITEFRYFPNGASGYEYIDGFMGGGDVTYRVLDIGYVGFSYPGHVFSHWRGDNGKTYYPGDEIAWGECYFFTAIWSEIIEVTYHANDGSGNFYRDYFIQWIPTEKYCVQSPEWMFPDPGYTFAGWNTKADGTGGSYGVYEEITLTGDLELYAQWSKPLPYTITLGSVPALAYLQYDKLYERVFTITPWPVEGVSFTIRAGREWGDRNYLDVFYNGVNILGNEVPVTDISGSGTFTTKIRYSPPLVTSSIEPVRIAYILTDDQNNSWTFTDDWNGKNALEIVTRWQGENLRCSTASTEAYAYQTDDGFTGYKTYLCSQGGFWLDAVPETGYRFEGWYLDSGFTQRYSDLRRLGYKPTQSVFRLFPKVINDDV